MDGFAEFYQEMLQISGQMNSMMLPMIDSIDVSRTGSRTVYTMKMDDSLNSLLEDLLTALQEELAAMESPVDLTADLQSCTYVYTVGSDGELESCTADFDLDLVLGLPVGTLVFAEGPEGERLLADLSEPDSLALAARGGRGGKGNEHFKSATMRAPRFAQPGEPGEELNLRLELKILADAGLIGLPNAGKSTFISRVSAARPKIAAYPFTTLTPNLGVMIDEVRTSAWSLPTSPALLRARTPDRGWGTAF